MSKLLVVSLKSAQRLEGTGRRYFLLVLAFQLQLGVCCQSTLTVNSFTNIASVETFDQKDGQIRSNGGTFSLDSNALKNPIGVEANLNVISALVKQSEHASPTKFHHMLDMFAARGDNMRVYTQNIDDLENRLPHLSSDLRLAKGSTTTSPTNHYANVVQMHGTINQMCCTICQEVADMDLSLFDNGFPNCPFCMEKHLQPQLQRTRNHHPRLQARSVGILRPHVLLYGDPPDIWSALDFGEVMEFDIVQQPPDTVVVAGTNLRISQQRNFVKRLCKAAHQCSPQSTTIWLNTLDIPSPLGRAEIFDYAMKGTAEEFAQFITSL